MAETYEQYTERLAGLNVEPLSRPRWARSEARIAWMLRMDDLDTPLSEEEVEKLMVELRNANASHKRYPVPTYAWAADCPHDVDEPDADHQEDEDGELYCLLTPTGEVCICGDGYCERLAELSTAADEFWDAIRHQPLNAHHPEETK